MVGNTNVDGRDGDILRNISYFFHFNTTLESE